MNPKINYYDILGVLPSIEIEAIEPVYLTLIRKYDISTNRSLSSDEIQKIQQVNEAFQILGNSESRWAYDQLRTEFQLSPEAPKTAFDADMNSSDDEIFGPKIISSGSLIQHFIFSKDYYRKISVLFMLIIIIAALIIVTAYLLEFLRHSSMNSSEYAQKPIQEASTTANLGDTISQKAMLVMEPSDQSSPAPTLNGRVVWNLETLKSVVDNGSKIGARATIEIAEVGLNATIIFRSNRDPQSANSHMIEVNFTLADNNTTGKVRDIRVPELRSDENARGTALSGVPVPVTENVFLVGLNALPSEMQKNIDLLRAQNWFAMPLRFANGKRGILMFEKGKTGKRFMEIAMQAWNNG